MDFRSIWAGAWGVPPSFDNPWTHNMNAFDELYTEISVCTACSLAKGRLKVVPGEGPPTAKIMFIGEAPGWHENQQGRPFVGPAGKFLNELVESIGLSRSDVYICNVVKCRPPNNRDPLPDELAACDPFLQRQIALVKPRIIVTLGRYSMGKFFPGASISRIHGMPRRQNGIIYFPMYHPAAALHQPALRKIIEADMQKLVPLLAESEMSPVPNEAAVPTNPETHTPDGDEPTQLRLF